MPDVLSDDASRQSRVETLAAQLAEQSGYKPIRLPLVERVELFERAAGATSDIVTKEMYKLEARSDDELVLRPEGTAGCVRAVIHNQLAWRRQTRLYYIGSMFRYERPQRGRFRQFQQFGIEAFGMQDIAIDLEVSLLGSQLVDACTASRYYLDINHLGDEDTRARYSVDLADFLRSYYDELDEDSKNRVETNPLRVWDTKSPTTRKLLESAPQLGDYLDEAQTRDLNAAHSFLRDAGVACRINPSLVRGLDYYTGLVSEWVSTVGEPLVVGGGGRYDHLASMLGAKQPIPAVGFAMGVERLALGADNSSLGLQKPIKIFVARVDAGTASGEATLALARRLRDADAGMIVEAGVEAGSSKAQLNRAKAAEADFVLSVDGEYRDLDSQVFVRSTARTDGGASPAWEGRNSLEQVLDLMSNGTPKVSD